MMKPHPLKTKKEKRDGEEEKCERKDNTGGDREGLENNCKIKHKKIKSIIKQHKISGATSEDVVSRDSGRDSLDSSKSDDGESQNINDSVKHRKKKQNYLQNPFAPIENRKINIVKTIIISKNQCTPSPEVANTSKINDAKKLLLSEIIKKADFSQETNVNCEKNDEETNKDALMNSNSSLVEDAKKRKRIRVHKRKNKNKDVEEELSQEVTSAVLNLTPQLPPTKLDCAGQHIRFTNDSEVPVSTMNDENIKDSQDISQENSGSNTNILKIIANNESVREFIEQHPCMQNVQPKIGDIVGFKILRISENYTPEISDWIVGKVSAYENTEVIFDIMYGQEQCSQPQGKFSCETEETETDNTLQCNWYNVLEARLLY